MGRRCNGTRHVPGVFPARTGCARWCRSESTASVRAGAVPTERAGCSGRCLVRRCGLQLAGSGKPGADCSRADVVLGRQRQSQGAANCCGQRHVEQKDVEESDWFRIGRVYAEAGRSTQGAETVANRALASEAERRFRHARYGAYTNVLKDRAKAEELFLKAFKKNSREFWHWVGAGKAGTWESLHSNVGRRLP